MKKYYELQLNCGRVRDRAPFSNCCGFIEIWPIKVTAYKQSIFGAKPISTIDYKGWQYVIAELKDDHFEDVVLGKKIYFDPNGLRDITTASIDELMSNLNHGLTCYHMNEINQELATYYKEKIESDINVFKKYKDELSKIARKENVINEIVKILDKENSVKDNKTKKRILNIKSA